MDEAALSIAPVTHADLAAVEAYLAARSDTCMFLRSNLCSAGLAWTHRAGRWSRRSMSSAGVAAR